MNPTNEAHWNKAKKLVKRINSTNSNTNKPLLLQVAAGMFEAGYYPLNPFDKTSGAAGVEKRLTTCIEQMRTLQEKAVIDQVTHCDYILESAYVSLSTQNLFHYVRNSNLRVRVPEVDVTDMLGRPLSEYDLFSGYEIYSGVDVYSTVYANIYSGISQLCNPELAPVFAGNSSLKDLVDKTRMSADELQYHINSRLKQLKALENARKSHSFY